MNKPEIIQRLKILQLKVKTPGRAYSKAQRDEMRDEISDLEVKLGDINLLEDIDYINKFEKEFPSYFTSDNDGFKNQIDYISANTTEPNLPYVLKYKIKSLYNELERISSCQKDIRELIEAISYLKKNEKIPYPNPYSYQSIEYIQRILASKYKNLIKHVDTIKSGLSDTNKIIHFFHNDTDLKAFVFLSDAVFTEASSFEKGFSIAAQGSRKMYYTFSGDAYTIDTDEGRLPRIEKHRENPDLIPYQEDNTHSNLMGFKNSRGEIIIPAKYESASTFVNGFAKVGVLKEKYTKLTYGLIDSQGRLVLPCDFIELDDVYNDIVLYKERKYQEGYERKSAFDFNVEYQIKPLGLHIGFLIFGELKPAIISEIDKINLLDKTTYKTRGEVDNANDKIQERRERIDFYLKYITNNSLV